MQTSSLPISDDAHGAPPPRRARPFLLTEQEAAELIGVTADTLKVWRSKSRRAGKLIGPRWVELAGEGVARIIRYRMEDLDAWVSAGVVRLEPRKRRGRPRKEAQP